VKGQAQAYCHRHQGAAPLQQAEASTGLLPLQKSGNAREEVLKMLVHNHIKLALITPDNAIHEVVDLYHYDLDKPYGAADVLSELRTKADNLDAKLHC